MPLTITCALCATELNEPGALFFSSPEPGDEQVTKLHLCVGCERRVGDAMHVIWQELGEP